VLHQLTSHVVDADAIPLLDLIAKSCGKNTLHTLAAALDHDGM